MHAQDLYERLAAGYDYDPMYGELCTERDRLKKENAKLRELVRVAHGCKTDDGCCEDCWGDYGECPVETEMKELGIEVE